ncbi:hypothetical protein FRC02_003248 [Tulasnella sp. 418]|nr:hypothetical protein FRC02_003248 [Tulasnella sp. 418]
MRDQIKEELDHLRHKLHKCVANLQLSCAVSVRTDTMVANLADRTNALWEGQDALSREPKKLKEKFNTLNQDPQAKQGSAEEIINSHINDANNTYSQETDNALYTHQYYDDRKAAHVCIKGQDLPHVEHQDIHWCSEGSSINSSHSDMHLLRRRVHELATTLPELLDRVLKPKTHHWFDQFHLHLAWKSDNHSSHGVGSSIRETLRILHVLESGQRVMPFEAARELFSLGRSLAGIGLHEATDEIYDAAVRICHELASTSCSRNLFHLVQFLYERFLDIATHGKLEDACRVLGHAIKIRHQLQEQDERIYLVCLARSLTIMASQLRSMKHGEATICGMREVVDIRQQLVKVGCKRCLNPLASSLHNLAYDLDHVGYCDEAVRVGEEAVQVDRELVKMDRKHYLLGLSQSLHQQAIYLDKAGRIWDAVKVGAEAVRIRRELLERDRKAYLSCLSQSLHNCALYLDKVGSTQKAAKMEEESVKLARELVSRDRENLMEGSRIGD